VKLLLTSSGISNPTIQNALVELLGKPIAESNALIVPTAILPFSMGPTMAARLIRGEVSTPMADVGWASLGVLDLTSLPSIRKDVWVPTVESADALLFWGGDPLYLSFWMHESGLVELLPSLSSVYVGTTAGAKYLLSATPTKKPGSSNQADAEGVRRPPTNATASKPTASNAGNTTARQVKCSCPGLPPSNQSSRDRSLVREVSARLMHQGSPQQHLHLQQRRGTESGTYTPFAPWRGQALATISFIHQEMSSSADEFLALTLRACVNSSAGSRTLCW
jgi:hypothetical protein